MVLASAEHISRDASEKLIAWVKAGGAVIGDGFPGAFDDLGRPNGMLQSLFGVRTPESKTKTNPAGSLEESSQGYGEVTINALSPRPTQQYRRAEMWQQWDSTHPVALALGDYELSGFGRQNVQCVAGEVVGMTFGGKPGVVVNDIGDGHAMYVAMLLGTLYSSSCTAYEQDTAHSGHAPQRLMDAFLRYAGLQPLGTTALPITASSKLRIERPLRDSRGNVLIGIESFNDLPLEDVEITLAWPDSLVQNPAAIFWAANGSRKLTLISARPEDGTLTVTLEHLNTHGTLLVLQDSLPLVSLDIAGPRGIADMIEAAPSQTLPVTATIYNPSPRPLETGELTVQLPLAWSMSMDRAEVPPIGPGESRMVTFMIGTPAGSAPRSLEPLLVNYSAGDVKAMPTTEMLWLVP